ncbi:unnamed protein product [Triticum turgidum subsp. durum]|uniref:Uncharacterized protein n=1 Tax=Triticum turgidum subsp. durum TaxID=4567 RepID=A0A9R0XVW3_TRITD|nr:unnamed protein product [Triticum turgidum subsp. durum]
MPKRTMGGRADTGFDAMAHKASKHRAKLHMEKPLPAGEGSSRQQGGRDVVDHVQAPVQVSPMLEQVTPLPRHLPSLPQPVVNVAALAPQTEQVTPPVPEPVVVATPPFMWAPLAALAPQTEQVSPLSRVTPPVPEPVVAGDVNKDDVSSSSGSSAGAGGGSSASAGCSSAADVASPAPTCGRHRRERRRGKLGKNVWQNVVLSDDVDSDQETQRIYRRQKARELNSGVLEKRIRP